MPGSRASKGCEQCRRRKVRCDEGKPSCQRCLKRGENCTGYRDLAERNFVFKDENEKTALVSQRKSQRDTTSSSSTDIFSTGEVPTTRLPGLDEDEIDLSSLQLLDIGLNPTPWLKPDTMFDPSTPATKEKLITDTFFERYVIPPCTSNSTPGFLEYLPMLFEEVPIPGRTSLRHAVRAASYASLAASLLDRPEDQSQIRRYADTYYGHALRSLGEMLGSEKDEEKVSDYALMTIVVLDLFEAIFLPSPDRYGAHTEGMAQILRLRTNDQLRTPRGWSLWRLSHHRIQKQQLAFPLHLSPAQTVEQDHLIAQLNEELPENKIEKTNFDIVKVCRRARELRARISPVTGEQNASEMIKLISEMHNLESESVAWRAGSHWAYRTILTSTLTTSKGEVLTAEELQNWPEEVGLYPDLWIIYELNYQRTGRVILQTQILECLGSLGSISDVDQLIVYSRNTITALINEILGSVPQSLGHMSSNGVVLRTNIEDGSGEKGTSAIGAYFLLWSIKIIRSSKYASEEQKGRAREVFRRIRKVTGMVERGVGYELQI